MARHDVFIGWAGDRATGHNPADSTTYFFGCFNGINPSTGSVGNKRPIAAAGTLVAAVIRITVGGTLGSSETFTMVARVNNTTDVTLTTSAQMDAATQDYTVTGLSTALARGDRVEIKFTTPAWTTNPTGAAYGVTLEIESP